MHILLIYANRPRLTYGFLPGPYGLETLRAYLPSDTVAFDIINPFLSLDGRACLRSALRSDTSLIGISFRNLDDALVLWSPGLAQGGIQTESCLEDARQVVQWCRELAPGVPIVLGGAAFGHMPEPLLTELGGDAGFRGPSEHAFGALVDAMANSGECFRDALARLSRGQRIVGTKRPRSRQLLRPVTQREDVYFRFRGEAPVRTYQGCPLACSHCIEHVGTRYAIRSPLEVVADEVESVVDRYADVRRIFLADSEVNLVGEDRTIALIRAIRARSSSIPLVGYFNPRPMSRTLLTTLHDQGCEVRLTVDHVSDAVLRRNGKNFRQYHLRALVDHHAELGIPLSFCFLFGQPGETRTTVDEALRFVDGIPESIRGPIYFSPGVRVYPGTPLDDDLRAGRLDRKWVVAGGPSSTGVEPWVYCEGWRPEALFEAVRRHGGGRLQPMNGYLADLDATTKARLEEEFRAWHIGAANLDHADDVTWLAWSKVDAQSPILDTRKRIELLWARGRLALEHGRYAQAVQDWELLDALLDTEGRQGRGRSMLDHNLAVARQALASG